jgi:hypothetical protein
MSLSDYPKELGFQKISWQYGVPEVRESTVEAGTYNSFWSGFDLALTCDCRYSLVAQSVRYLADWNRRPPWAFAGSPRCHVLCPRRSSSTRPLGSVDNHATTNADPPRTGRETRSSARDLVLAGLAVGGNEQLAVGALQVIHREPVVSVAA